MSTTFSPARLKAARLRAELTREELGRKVGRGYPAIAAYEAGTYAPPLRVLKGSHARCGSIRTTSTSRPRWFGDGCGRRS